MQFVRIEHIDDVAPHISNEKGFVVSRRADHSVIDYVFTVEDSFDTAIARECRGLKFDADGRIIGRPFHKFFNLGEKQRIEDIDWSAPHAVLDKLDGSMVHPVMLAGELVFMTRMGAMEQARKARAHADGGLMDLCRLLLADGVTPIFEFTAPDNRIVVAYDAPRLTFLAAREIVSGAYWPHAELERIAARFGVPLVESFGAIGSAKEFVARARGLEGIEGYVMAFDDGHRIKLKTDAYVLRHKALASVQLEKNILALVAGGAVDDLVPLLAPDIAARLRDYDTAVNAGIMRHVDAIGAFVAEHRALPRKDFAALTMSGIDKRLRGVVFATLDGKDTRAALLSLVVDAARSETRVEAVRDLFGMSWSIDDLALSPDLEA